MATVGQIEEAIGPVLDREGLLVDEIVLTPAGRRSVLRISVDRVLDLADGVATEPTAPLTLDEVADATRLVSAVLDDSDVMGESPYTLEVSSPGVSRPLTEPRHFQRNIGRLVTATRRDGTTMTGRLVRADGASAILRAGDPPADVDIAYADLTRAVVQVEFNRPGSADDESEN